jgi:hypothetical protein
MGYRFKKLGTHPMNLISVMLTEDVRVCVIYRDIILGEQCLFYFQSALCRVTVATSTAAHTHIEYWREVTNDVSQIK